MRTIVIILLLATQVYAGNELTGSVGVSTNKVQKYDYLSGNSVEYSQRVVAKLGVKSSRLGLNANSIASLNINDVRDIAAEIQFSINLP